MIFDRYANVVASHQIEFPQYYPEPGYVYASFFLSSASPCESLTVHVQLARA